MGGLCGRDLDQRAFGLRRRNGSSGFSQTLDVESDRFLDQPQYLGPRLAGGDAARQIWNVGAPAAATLLDNDEVLQGSS